MNALLFLHTKGFIHRDVKCENLLIGHNGEIKLGKLVKTINYNKNLKKTLCRATADFGLATSTRHVNRERLGTAKVKKKKKNHFFFVCVLKFIFKTLVDGP